MKPILIAFLIFISYGAFAQSTCEAVIYSEGYTTFSSEGKNVTYSLNVSSPNWSSHGYGWHGTAAIVCEKCTRPEYAWGLVHLSEIPEFGPKPFLEPSVACLLPPNPSGLLNTECEALRDEHKKELGRPPIRTAKERIERGQELLYYPFLILSKNDLSPVFMTDGLSIDGLSGYGVVYEIKNPEAKGIPATINGLIAFEMHDSCASFSGTIGTPLDEPEDHLRDLMSSISVVKSFEELPKE